jgi:H+-transporting ATPase
MTDHRTEYSSSSSETPDHLRTTIPSGGLVHEQTTRHDNGIHESGATDSGAHHISEKEKDIAPPDEGEDEDIDALIAELESEDGDAEEEEEAEPGMSAKPIPEELLNTDTRKGISSLIHANVRFDFARSS